jgi:hypothetical protein
MRVIYTSKGMSKKFGVRVIKLGARYLSKNTVIIIISPGLLSSVFVHL